MSVLVTIIVTLKRQMMFQVVNVKQSLKIIQYRNSHHRTF